jgi:hypothetical protein
MTDRLALILGLILAGLLGADLWMGWGGTMFVLRRLDALIEWLAFWR